MPDDEMEAFRDPFLEKPLPSSPESERAVLGAINRDNSLMAQAIELLPPMEDGSCHDFYIPAHLLIYKIMVILFKRGSEINPILIAEELRRSNALDSVGGILFLNNLSYGLPPIISLEEYTKIIKGKAVLRELHKAGNKIAADALEEGDPPSEVLDRSVKAIFEITLEHTTKTFSSLEVISQNSLQKAYDIQKSGKVLTGITTGFPDLNELTLGWQPSDLILIAGRPGHGKTSFGIALSRHAAKTGARVAFFSLEMPDEQIAMRFLCAEANLDSRKFRSGFLSEEDWGNLGDAHNVMTELGIYVDDTPAISVPRMKAKAMRLAAEQKQLDLIVIDYLGLMSGNPKHTDYQRITEISRELKGVARELKLPLIALCQLNRGPENRTDHRPILGDLRESGALEQDADVVIFTYRADKYRQPKEEKDHTAEIIVAKQRNGPIDTAYLRFDEASTRFDNLDRKRGPSQNTSLIPAEDPYS